MSRRRQRGFTLIEMMVVVLIAGALAALAVSAFGRQKPRQQLNGFALELQAALHQARQTALASGQQVVVMVFPNQATPTGIGRIITYQDGDFTFFSAAAAVNFDGYDPATTAAGARSQVLDVLDLQSNIVVGPATGQGAGAAVPAPFAGIPVNLACPFCTGAGGRGAIVFQPGGTATFQDRNGPALALPLGASLSFTSPDSKDVRTILVVAATGVAQALRPLTIP